MTSHIDGRNTIAIF